MVYIYIYVCIIIITTIFMPLSSFSDFCTSSFQGIVSYGHSKGKASHELLLNVEFSTHSPQHKLPCDALKM